MTSFIGHMKFKGVILLGTMGSFLGHMKNFN